MLTQEGTTRKPVGVVVNCPEALLGPELTQEATEEDGEVGEKTDRAVDLDLDVGEFSTVLNVEMEMLEPSA